MYSFLDTELLYLIYFGSKDEIIAVKTVHGMGMNFNVRIPPAEGDVGVVLFFFRHFPNLIDKMKSLREVSEGKRLY